MYECLWMLTKCTSRTVKMAICKFFQQGNCRNGGKWLTSWIDEKDAENRIPDRCKFEHVDYSGRSNISSSSSLNRFAAFNNSSLSDPRDNKMSNGSKDSFPLELEWSWMLTRSSRRYLRCHLCRAGQGKFDQGPFNRKAAMGSFLLWSREACTGAVIWRSHARVQLRGDPIEALHLDESTANGIYSSGPHAGNTANTDRCKKYKLSSIVRNDRCRLRWMI